MTLLPTRAEYCTQVIFNKTANGTAGNTLPTTLTVQVESTPLVRGVMKRRIFLPYITKTTEAALSWAEYVPAPGTTENLKPAFRGGSANLYAPGPNNTQVTNGQAWLNPDGVAMWISFNANAVEGYSSSSLDIETITKTL